MPPRLFGIPKGLIGFPVSVCLRVMIIAIMCLTLPKAALLI